MKKRIYNLRWHLTKKRWHKQWGEYRYNLKQNIRGFKKKLRIFFTPQRRGQMRRKKTPAIGLLLVILSSGTLIGIWHYTPNVWRTYKSWKAFNDAKNTGVREMQSMHSGVLRFHPLTQAAGINTTT